MQVRMVAALVERQVRAEECDSTIIRRMPVPGSEPYDVRREFFSVPGEVVDARKERLKVAIATLDVVLERFAGGA